jgi:acetyl esterase/lipase
MKKTFIYFILILSTHSLFAQPEKKDLFPPGTTVDENIPYAGDTLKKHLLDIYFPAKKKLSYPIIVWIHGGAWMKNDKHADMSYMTNTLKLFLDKGYAVASIDYRYSTTAPFPAQIQDCNQAIEFLFENGAQYGINGDQICLIGFSAGAHLASLIGLSNNVDLKLKKDTRDFYHNRKEPQFKINLVLDFYGNEDLTTAKGHDSTDPNEPITLLLGGTVAAKPDMAKKASPINYIDKKDPPFLIVQGEKDESVNPDQSVLLSQRLTKAGVKNQLIIVPGAPHYGEMFDAQNIREAISDMLDQYMK